MDNIRLQTNYGVVSGTDNFYISAITFDIRSKKVVICLEGNAPDANGNDNWNGIVKMIEYSGEKAVGLMALVNTKDFSKTSLKKTILAKLVADGHLSGEVL